MKHLVLVVDDQWEERSAGYERLARAVTDSGFEIKFKFLEQPNNLQSLIQRDVYTAAIVDAVLDEKWHNFTITSALKLLGDELPIAVLSARWDSTNTEQINEAWEKPNCRTFLHWRDIKPGGSGQIDYAVRALISMIADNKSLYTKLTLEPNESIRILHISDVHVGGSDASKRKLEANLCADRILEHWGDRPPTFIVFTGDVAEHGSPAQYEVAHEWITYFVGRFGMSTLPSATLLYVPGNHDVNLRMAAAARVKIEKRKASMGVQMVMSNEIQEELLEYAYAPFRSFRSKLSNCPLLTDDIKDQGLAWVEGRFRQFGVVFYGVNTAQPASAFDVPARQVSPNSLSQIGVRLGQVLEDCGEQMPLVIGLGHHCPLPAEGDGAVENPGEFSKFFRGRVKTGLFLHGHIHEHDLVYTSNDGLRLVRSCATTLTKNAVARPADSLRGFNLLELSREMHNVTSLTATSYGWIGSKLKDIKTDTWQRKDDGMFREIFD